MIKWDRGRWIYAMLALMVAGAAGWVGYRNEVAAVTAAGKAPLTFRSAARQLMTPKSDRDAVEQLEELRQRAGRGPLTPAEKLDAWRIIRGFSEEQVKNYLKDLPAGNWYSSNGTLAMMLFQRWAHLDPDGAERELKNERYAKDTNLLYAVLGARVSRDPEEAMKWLETAGSEEMKRIGGRIIGGLLARENPATALKRTEQLGDHALGAALRVIGRDMSGSAESRKEFYALEKKYGKTKEWSSVLIGLSYHAAEKDAEDLLASVKGTGLPPEQSMKIRDTAISMLMQTEPLKAMEWTISPSSGTTREKQLSVYRSWASGHAKEATEWAVRNGRQDFIADTLRKQRTDLVRSGREQWTHGGPKTGWIEGTVTSYQAWRAHDSAAAESWADTLPTDIREHLNETPTDATK